MGPVVLEAGGCSGPWRWEASEIWEEGGLSGRGMAGMAGAAVGVARGLGTGQRASRLEDQEEEKTQAERKEGVLSVGMSPGQGETGRRRRQAGPQVEVLRRRGAGLEGRTAVAGTLGGRVLGWVEAQDPSRRREESFAERKEEAAAVQER